MCTLLCIRSLYGNTGTTCVMCGIVLCSFKISFSARFPRTIPYSSLPDAWLEVNDSSNSADPPVHLQFASPWLPELRSLLLGGNSMDATGYAVLQTVANWRSLQTLDLSDNALTGSVEDALTLYYYCDGSGGTGCGGSISSVAAPLLRLLKLDRNNLTGETEKFTTAQH